NGNLTYPTTPPDYHRIISPTVKVPSDPQTAVPVGLLACQRDPLLRTLETVVVECKISQPVIAPANKKAKKAVVILHDTVIFPEGGGQPTDTGVINAGGLIWDVIQAKRHGGYAVHYMRVRDGDVNAALGAFTAGNNVTVSLDNTGYDRRYDHMSMHTSQHLLSALLETRLDLPTLSWSLTNYPTPCYVEVPRGMSQEEIASIQQEANRLVFEGRKVHVEVEELDRDQEKGVERLASGRAVGKALPEDYTGGVKRVVVIDGVDRNPCCGTHLPSIHNLQLFLLPHTDALSRSSTTSARLYFSTLSCGAPLVPERVSQVVDERKRAEKRVVDIEEELAKFIAKGLIQEMNQESGELYKKHVHRTDDTSNALGFLTAISFAISNAAPTQKHIVVLTSSPSAQTTTSGSVVMVSGSDDNRVKTLGGGKGLKWSGKFTGVWKENRESALIQDILNEM
ncbi:hypothetical protein BD779DRAFT_1491147, partial [Infundibulicybe gibba]